MPTKLTIAIPNFNLTFTQAEQGKFSALKLLLARADKKINPETSVENLIFKLFSMPTISELPIAAVTGLADGLPTQDGYWLRADPVQLRADLAAVYFLGNEHLSITQAQVTELSQLLNNFLKQDDLILHTPHPKRWYLQLSNPAKIKTRNPNDVIGKDIYAYLPFGEEQTYWRKLFTELQMVLHEKGEVNALWFWGNGKLPQITSTHWQTIWTDEVTTQGLAKLANANLKALPEKFSDCLSAINIAGDYLIVIDTLSNKIDSNWFAPLVSALRSGKITNLRLYLGDQCQYDLTRKDIFKFWRRRNFNPLPRRDSVEDGGKG